MYSLKDLKHLEVMSNLASTERKSVPKIKLPDIFSPESRELSLSEKILSLCTKLRNDGFVKQAESLENKFMLYTTASTHLYKAFDETGDDLLNAAHPDGDNKVEEASDTLGDVETLISQHNKIVNVVNKQPTGKQAFTYKDAVKFITAYEAHSPQMQEVSEDFDKVNLQELSQKFKYMSDYLATHFLTVMPEGSTLPPNKRSFYGTIGLWKELADKLANELNKNQLVPLVQAIQLVKNNLASASFAASYVQKVNSVSDIDKMVSWILGWAEDNNPIKRTGSLNKYVDECKQALHKEAVLLIPVILWIWSKTNRINQGIKKNTEILLSEMSDLSEKEEINKNINAINKLNEVKENLYKLQQKSEEYTAIETQPSEKDLTTINDYEQFINNVIRPSLTSLYGMMARIRRQDEESISSSVFRTFVASDYEDVQKAIVGLNKAIEDMALAISTARAEAMKSTTNKPTPSANLQVMNDNSLKQSEISKLTDWKIKLMQKNIDEAQKEHVARWLNGQIAELQSADTPDKVNKIVEEDKRFEAKGII